MLCTENDLYSICSESTIYASDIVSRDIEEYERNQRLRHFGLLTNIQEESYIDFIESSRNCDNTDRTRLDRDFVTDEEQQNSTFCFKLKKCNLKKIIKSQKKLFLISCVSFFVVIISLNIFWMFRNQNIFYNDANLTTTEKFNTEATKPSIHIVTTFPGITDGMLMMLMLLI